MVVVLLRVVGVNCCLRHLVSQSRYVSLCGCCITTCCWCKLLPSSSGKSEFWYVMHANVDLIFLCETWLRQEGDESDCAALTPPGFCLRSFPRMSGAGGGLAVLYRNSLTKNIAVSTRDFVFTAFEICEVRISLDSHIVVFFNVYRPPPSRKNKLTNAMFLEQFIDLLESYVACDRLL